MLNEIFRLVGTIVIESESAKKSIDSTVEHAEKQQKTMRQKLADFGKVTIKVAAAFATAAAAVGTAIVNVTNDTREYRQQMGQLETAFKTNGLTAGQATKTYEGLYAVLGQTDRSVEAATHIATLSDNTAELQGWVDICTGVYAKFGESLPVETLMESARETADTGKLTGDLTKALSEAGVSEEEFQKKLDNCNDTQERSDLIGRTLIGTYSTYADTYRENNREVMEANSAHQALNAAMAAVGEAAEPAVTAMTTETAKLLESVVPMITAVSTAICELIDWWNQLEALRPTQAEADTAFLSVTHTTDELREMGYDSLVGYDDPNFDPSLITMKAPAGFSSGLDFVPRDDMPARLHYGEAVLTRSEANAWRHGQGSGIDYDKLAEAMAERPLAFNIDGKAFAVMLAREMNRAIGNRNIQTVMAMGG